MKYETAKALKEAGFPQSSENWFNSKGGYCNPTMEICECADPSLSELIEACGNDLKYIAKITIRTGESEVTDGWEVCQNVDKNEIAFAIQEFTLEEALAKFYIALHKV